MRPNGTSCASGLVKGFVVATLGLIFGKGAVSVAVGGVLFSNVFSFNVATNGSEPDAALLQASDGSLYGTTQAGGLYGVGSIFRITTDGSYSLVYSFGTVRSSNGWPLDGAAIETALILGNDGAFYGTTSAGGISNAGVIFRMSTNGALTTLYSFTNGVDGSEPNTLALGADGNFYGTAYNGGTNGYGVAFQMTPQGILTVIHSFPDSAGGPSYPRGFTVGSDGLLYGVCWGNGDSGYGAIFKMSTNGTINYLHQFSGADGEHPYAELLLGPDGDFYGATLQGGTNQSGAIFKTSTNGSFTLLYSFGAGGEGSFPEGKLVPSGDGGFYGTTLFGGTNFNGSVYEISAEGVVTTIFSFGTVDAPEGGRPLAGLTLGLDGNFYGTATSGGTNDSGAIFVLTPGVGVSPFYSMGGPVFGAAPESKLTVGGDGSLYGTVTYAGAAGLLYGAGTGFGGIFKIDPSGAYSVLYIFTNGVDGSYPTAGLTLGSDGSLYGVAASGGMYDNGTVFKLTEGGTFTSLYSFSGFTDGGRPSGELTAYGATAFYGTTFGGGAEGLGTVFEITTGGQFTPIYSFTGSSDGAGPEAGLTVGCDGNLYGVASSGGASDAGTVFEITTNGGLTNLHSFSGSDGAGPIARLTLGGDGNFYGTTFGGGTYGGGVIFKIDTNGNFAVLQMLNGVSGVGSLGQLLQAEDGAFYGTTSRFGVSPDGNYPHPAEWDGDGTIVRITGTGDFSVVYSFGQISDEGYPLDGANPYAGLVAGAGGALYGTTYQGGAAGNGTIFQLTLPPIAAPVFQSVSRAGETTTLSWNASWGVPYQLQYTENLDSTAWTNVGPVRATTNSIITVDDSVSDPQRFYRVYVPW